MGKRSYIFCGKLLDIQMELEMDGFLRIHPSYLSNYNFISAITYKEVTIGNRITLLLGGSRGK